MTIKVERLLVGASLAGLLGMLFSASARADVPATVDAYQGIAHAAGVHAIYYTATLSSLNTGALDNRYPDSGVYQDVAPSANATSSTEDGGPLMATLYAIGKSPQQFPYAKAQYPPTPQAPASDTCDPSHSDPAHDCPAGTATASARELGANAQAVYNGQPGTAGSPSFDNATSQTATSLNPDGSLAVHTHSHVGTATFGGGVLKVQNVDVVTDVKSVAGLGSDTDTVAPGTVTFNNQPVQVTDQGVSVGPVGVPTSGISTGNGASFISFRLFTVAPEKSQQGNHATVSATGLHVVVSQGAPLGNNGIPPNSVEYILGEGQADGFAVPATPTDTSSGTDISALTGSTDLGVGTSLDTSTTTDTGGGYTPTDTVTIPSTVVNPPTSPRKGRVPGLALASLSRPNLAAMFFAWEALIMATAAALVWARRKRLASLEL